MDYSQVRTPELSYISPTEELPNDRTPSNESGTSCARCRRLKIKCIFAEGERTCRRCTSSKQRCEQAVSKRRAKRTQGDKVTQLEETVASLTSTIQKMKRRSSSPSVVIKPGLPSPVTETSSTSGSWLNNSAPSMSSMMPLTTSASSYRIDKSNTGIDELISGGTVTQERLLELFEIVRCTIAPSLKAVRIPEHIGYWDLYHQRPIMLQALVTTASATDALLYPVLYDRLRNRLLHEYFMEHTRNIDLVQALLFSCEFFAPTEQPRVQSTVQSWAPLATEVALDIGMFSEPLKPRLDAFDSLEYERTLIWLNVTFASMSVAHRRLPQRVVWTNYHTICKVRLEASHPQDCELARMTDLPRLAIEIQEAGPLLKSLTIVNAFQQKISGLKAELGCKAHPSSLMLLGTIVIALYENHIRYATETPGSALNIPQLEIAVELCKKAATGILYLIQKLPGSAIGYPTYFLIKPLHCLIIMSKIYRLLDITDGTWLQDYANSTTVTLTNLSERGSVLARSAVDKPNKILLWWRECENIAPTDTSLQVLEWLNAKTENELNQFQQTTDDFQMFADLFGIISS